MGSLCFSLAAVSPMTLFYFSASKNPGVFPFESLMWRRTLHPGKPGVWLVL
jgi:hypothetical protein